MPLAVGRNGLKLTLIVIIRRIFLCYNKLMLVILYVPKECMLISKLCPWNPNSAAM
jgi:hypothetical protein